MTAGLLDHLWQSTLFAAVLAALMPLFRRQSAALRFRLWFAASVKFLIPFSLLTWVGKAAVPQIPAPALAALQPIEPSLIKAAPLVAPVPPALPAIEIMVGVWLIGMAALALTWLARWLELRAAAREAVPLSQVLPVPVKTASSFLEPGLVGLWRPIILLPRGLAQQLTQAELDAVLKHELAHLNRGDNLWAALHMLVEGLFWFHPLVWWMSARLMEERERACDEAVLAAGAKPLDYAQGILKTCRFYVQSPLACASGVSAALEMRLGAIMTPRAAAPLSIGKAMLLAGLASCAMLPPLAAGLVKPVAIAAVTAQIQAALHLPAIAATPIVAPRIALITSHPSPTVALAPALPVPAPEPRHLSLPAINLHLVLDADPPALPEPEAAPVCRPPLQLIGSRLKGPPVCLSAQRWAELKAQHLDVAPDGQTLIATDYEQQRAMSGQGCPTGIPQTSTGAILGLPSCF